LVVCGVSGIEPDAPRRVLQRIIRSLLRACGGVIAVATQLNLVYYAMGDQVCVTSIPEAWFTQKGERLFYSDPRYWVFRHNPYIDFREPEPDDVVCRIVPDKRLDAQLEAYLKRQNSHVSGSQTEFILTTLGLTDGTHRHPRLYVHEEAAILPHKVVVHTTGSDRTLAGEPAIRSLLGEDEVRLMSDDVIDAIARNYRDWMIVQVGGAADKPVPGRNVLDLRGKLDVWETAAEIASASRFIGVNSGPMHIANCYPRVSKRIVLMEFSRDYLSAHEGFSISMRPGDIRNRLTCWLDPSNAYFNRFERDYGASFSYLKI
jgi:hypothetical protein